MVKKKDMATPRLRTSIVHKQLLAQGLTQLYPIIEDMWINRYVVIYFLIVVYFGTFVG